MKILVTGGAGYIGTELVKRLATDPQVTSVVVYDNIQKNNYSFFLGDPIPDREKISFIEGDILDTRKLKKALKDVQFVYHLAAKVTTPFANVDAHYFEQVNHWGTAELVYAIEESDIEQLVFLSSSSIYGASKQLVDEASKPNPRTHYGISKMRGEDHVRRLQGSKRALILRCGNVYGYSRSMRFDAVINRFMFDANCNHRISINGDGKQHRGFIHIDAISDVLAQLVSTEVPSGDYNLVDKNIQILDIVDVLKEIYPGMEYLFVNQHMSLRELRVSTDSAIYQYVNRREKRSLLQELSEFKEQFSF
ncbi:MAG: SDR family oxidoreductase [Cyclobacteriaceae bacterium]